MTTMEVGRKLLDLCRAGETLQAIETMYSANAVSVENMEMPGLPAVMEGQAAIRGKNEWWYANNEVHRSDIKGPFPHGDRFALYFDFDVSPKAGPTAGQRRTMQEVGLYTVKDGKIVREEFFYATE